MPADRQARSALRDALIAYMRGEIGAFAFDDVNSHNIEAVDPALLEVSRTLWTFHDDFIDHPISVTLKEWELLKRVVAFLATNLESETAVKQSSPAWPFQDVSQWLANEHLSRDCGLPEYDAGIHCRQVQPWWNRIPTPVGIAVIIGCLALLMAFALLTANR